MNGPNVVLLTCHDLGCHLGCYGVPTVRSPRLDQLASDGVRLARHFCTAPQCSPSRAALATGRYPHSNGCMGLAHAEFDWSIGEAERHLARLLRDGGYHTVLFGHQHVTPRRPETGARLGFDEQHGGGSAERVADLVTSWLTEPGRRDRPFYLEANFAEPHRPYVRPTCSADESLGVWVPPWLPDVPEARQELAQLQGLIHYVDGHLGRIFDALTEADLAGNTWLVVQADHGIAMPRAKCTLYDPGIEAACLMRWPAGGLCGGKVFDELTSNVDFVPTVLEALDVAGPPNLQGRSYLPLLTGQAYTPCDAVFAEKTYHGVYDPMRCVRTRTHKLIRNFQPGPAVQVPGDAWTAFYAATLDHWLGARRQPIELYDLTADPAELANLAGDPACAAIQAELDHRLWSWMEETADPLLDGPVPCPFYLAAIAARRQGAAPP